MTSKTVFVKAATRIENTHVSGKNYNSSLSESKKEKFVHIYHYYNEPGHIRPKCFEYKNILRMSRMVKNVHKPRTAPKHKINLSRKYGLKKIRFELLCCFYFFKDSFYWFLVF